MELFSSLAGCVSLKNLAFALAFNITLWPLIKKLAGPLKGRK